MLEDDSDIAIAPIQYRAIALLYHADAHLAVAIVLVVQMSVGSMMCFAKVAVTIAHRDYMDHFHGDLVAVTVNDYHRENRQCLVRDCSGHREICFLVTSSRWQPVHPLALALH